MLQVRGFQEEDAEALGQLMAWLGPYSLLPVPLEVRLQRPGHCAGEDLLLAERDGLIVGWLDTFREPGLGRVVVEAGVAPGQQRRQIVCLLLRRRLQDAAATGVQVVHFSIPERDQAAGRWLEGMGFLRVRRFLRLGWQRKRVPPVPDWPPIRPMRAGEEGALTRIQNLSFGGSWGFHTNAEEEVRYRLGLPCCCREGVFFAEVEGRVVGYCWTRELRGKGEIWMLGADPAWRGQGVGRALLLRGIHHLRQRGFRRVDLTVDAANTTAIALYLAVGFRQVGSVVSYECRL
ncbi:MAG: GNAT family N-acetyltransferase [Chloroflexota bacterium]